MPREIASAYINLYARDGGLSRTVRTASQTMGRAAQRADRYRTSLRRLSRTATSSITSFVSLRGVMATVLGGGALGYAIKQQVEFSSRLVDTSRTLNLQTDALLGLRRAFEDDGQSLQTFDTALQRLTRRAGAAIDGNKGLQEAFAALNITLTDSEGHLRTSDALMYDLAQSVANTADRGVALARVQKLLDTEGVRLVGTMARLGGNLREVVQGHIAARNASAGQDETLKDLGQSFTDLRRAVDDAFSRTLVTHARELETVLQFMARVIPSLVDSFGQMAAAAVQMGEALKGLSPLAGLLGQAASALGIGPQAREAPRSPAARAPALPETTLPTVEVTATAPTAVAPPDLADEAWWQEQLGLRIVRRASEEYAAALRAQAAQQRGRSGTAGIGIPAFARGGYHAGGLALVGERGPELVDFRSPGRVYTNQQLLGSLAVRAGQAAEQQVQQALLSALGQRIHLEEQINSLVAARDRLGEQAPAALNAQIATAEAHLAVLREQEAATESLAAATGRVAAEQQRAVQHAAQMSQTVIGVSRAVGNFVQQAVTSFRDWNDVMRAGVGLLQAIIQELLQALVIAPLVRSVTAAIGIPAFARGGYHAGGLALVGERGPELVDFHSPGRVYTNQQLSASLAERGRSGEVILNFAPVIHGGDEPGVERALARMRDDLTRQVATALNASEKRMVRNLSTPSSTRRQVLGR